MTAAQAIKTDEKKPDLKQEPLQEERSRGQVANIAPPRIAYHPAIQQRFNIDQSGWRALIDAVWPSAKTAESVILALSYCKARNLDPFKRPVHIVPVWNSALKREVEGVWPGIGELRTTAFRTGYYAGCDETKFGPDKSYNFKGRVKAGQNEWKDAEATVIAPEWAQMTVYRIVAGQRVAFPGPKIYFLASYGRKGKTDLPNDKWQQMPSYMLEKVAEASSLRKAFPEEMGDMISAEEAEGQVMDLGGGQVGEVTTPPPQPRRSDFTTSDNVTDVSEDLDGKYHATMSGRQPDTAQERGDETEDGEQPEEQPDTKATAQGATAGEAPKEPQADLLPKEELHFYWIDDLGVAHEHDKPSAWIDAAAKALDAAFEAKTPVKDAWARNAGEWAKVQYAMPNTKKAQTAIDGLHIKLDELMTAEKERPA